MGENTFPIMEMLMNDHSLSIRLADEKASHQVTLSKEMMEQIISKWAEFQTGAAPEERVFGRWYTGTWHKEEMP